MERRLNVKGLLRKHGLRPKASWSQNFLVDREVLHSIAQAVSLDRVAAVVELGAGVGALSAMLAKTGRPVVAVERDRELASLLRGEFAGDARVEILEANAATLDYRELAERLGVPLAVVGNLPYHMATPILFNLLAAGMLLSHFVLMFQRELADRILASPGSRRYGVISVLAQLVAEIEPILEVPPEAFYPAPRVHSLVLRFWPLPGPRVEVGERSFFERVVRGVFAQRRKKVRNGLIHALSGETAPDGVDRALEMAGLEGGERAERLTLEDLSRLCRALLSQRDSQSGRRVDQ